MSPSANMVSIDSKSILLLPRKQYLEDSLSVKSWRDGTESTCKVKVFIWLEEVMKVGRLVGPAWGSTGTENFDG